MKTFRFVIGCRKPALSDHGGELVLLALIAIGVCLLSAIALWRGHNDAAGIGSTVLMAIVSAIKERWTSRSLDRMGQSLANAPPADPPTLPPGAQP